MPTPLYQPDSDTEQQQLSQIIATGQGEIFRSNLKKWQYYMRKLWAHYLSDDTTRDTTKIQAILDSLGTDAEKLFQRSHRQYLRILEDIQDQEDSRSAGEIAAEVAEVNAFLGSHYLPTSFDENGNASLDPE